MHTVCHFELPSTDLDRSKQFYEILFGWKIDKFSDEYLICLLGETESGGIYRVDKISSSQIAVYFHVEDIPATLGNVAKPGGKTLEEKRSIGEHGFIASFEDPLGLRINIWSKN